MRYLGVDPGGKRLGLAVADDATGIVTPLEVIPYRGVATAAADIAARVRTHDAQQVVVGLPTTADGEPTAACRRSHALARALHGLGLDTVLQPEYLSTNEARRRARDAGLPRERPVDHLAAQIVLEEYLSTREGG